MYLMHPKEAQQGRDFFPLSLFAVIIIIYTRVKIKFHILVQVEWFFGGNGGT